MSLKKQEKHFDSHFLNRNCDKNRIQKSIIFFAIHYPVNDH